MGEGVRGGGGGEMEEGGKSDPVAENGQGEGRASLQGHLVSGQKQLAVQIAGLCRRREGEAGRSRRAHPAYPLRVRQKSIFNIFV
eukprot:363423-Chlamydomonas_euryale.AAC.6